MPLVQTPETWEVLVCEDGLEIATRDAGFVGPALTDAALLVIRLVKTLRSQFGRTHTFHTAESAAREIGTCVFAGAGRDRFARREIARGPGSGGPHA